MSGVPKPLFCCSAALPINTSNSSKPYRNPNRETHDALRRSFAAFAQGQQSSASTLKFTSPEMLPPPSGGISPALVMAKKALENNPITENTKYAVHVVSRHDYGPAISHRYFVCPPDLQSDWTEVTLGQWFMRGAQFKLKVEKWDLKCKTHSKFFRLTLRPNLALRVGPAEKQSTERGRRSIGTQTDIEKDGQET